MYLKEGKNVTPPTLSLEASFFTLISDAHEGREVDNFDVPGEYLYAEIPKAKRILMNLREDSVDIMCQISPEYKQSMRYENEKVFYLLVCSDIYGCIESSLLWYKIFSTTP